MKHALEAGVFRILNSDLKSVGAGFLVAKCLVVTCAHVVKAAGGEPGGEILIDMFNPEGYPRRAYILPEGWDDPDHNDVAFLSLEEWAEELNSADPYTVLKAILSFLSAESAHLVLVNLEDLWLETEAQNVPGTQDEYLNWRRKARYSFETFSQLPQVANILHEVDRIRKSQLRNRHGC